MVFLSCIFIYQHLLSAVLGLAIVLRQFSVPMELLWGWGSGSRSPQRAVALSFDPLQSLGEICHEHQSSTDTICGTNASKQPSDCKHMVTDFEKLWNSGQRKEITLVRKRKEFQEKTNDNVKLLLQDDKVGGREKKNIQENIGSREERADSSP